MTRQEANKKILEKLTKMVEKYPDWRFGQLLVNCDLLEIIEPGIVADPFHEESEQTLKNILEL